MMTLKVEAAWDEKSICAREQATIFACLERFDQRAVVRCQTPSQVRFYFLLGGFAVGFVDPALWS
jgi:hypothetical protein